jgi:putative membrane protein
MRLTLLLTAALTFSACTTMAGGAATMAAQAAMTDADILQVFMTSNEGEIVTSRPAVDDSQNADVRQFAQDMIAMHTEVNQRAMALELDPRENQVSLSMRQNAMAKAAQIDRASGAAQDMTYMETQVVLHGHTRDMLMNVLIPNARDPQLKALLTQSLPTVEEHLRRAQQIHHGMMM